MATIASMNEIDVSSDKRSMNRMARRLGKPVAAHCHGADGIVAVAEAGVTTIEHGTMADERAVEAMKRKVTGTSTVPTFSPARGFHFEHEEGKRVRGGQRRHAACVRCLDGG